MLNKSVTGHQQLLREAYAQIKTLRRQIEESAASEPIAIVGAACRFPGGVRSLEQFWAFLRRGEDGIGPIPEDRWEVARFYDPNPDAPGRSYAREGGFLEEVDRFDAAQFGIAPREAISMDPQQRLLLEVCWEAFEHAGLDPQALKRSPTGVFVGMMYLDYATRLMRESGLDGIDAYLGTGNTFSAAAGRLSYTFGLTGPSMSVDTACSSSLVAIHLACASLRNNECTAAVAGGVNLILSPEAMINLAKARMISPTGRCRTFDASADGYVRGEGCGVVVLKRLAQARRDGDRVLGVIRGSAINQDGRSNGLTAPNGPSQRAVVQRALAVAGLDSSQVGYIECHGSGTPLGDPIEVNSLLEIFGDRPAETPLALGAVKTNVGHLEGAAGICGLLKALLVVQHREVPPSLHLQQLNPHISVGDRPVSIPTSPTPWFGHRPAVAGVSAFGFVGTNAHVIVEAPPAADVTRPPDAAHVFVLSAPTAGQLVQSAQAVLDILRAQPGIDLADLCLTTAAVRSQMAVRTAIPVQSREALEDGLRQLVANGAQSAPLPTGEPDVDALVARYLAGEAVDWRSFHQNCGGRYITLPPFPFRRTRFWYDPRPKGGVHPLLSRRLPGTAAGAATASWDVTADPAQLSYLRQHRLLGQPVWPVSAFVELALAAGRASDPSRPFRLRNVRFPRSLESCPPDRQAVQASLEHPGSTVSDFTLWSRAGESSAWTDHCRATIDRSEALPGTGAGSRIDFGLMFFAARDESSSGERYDLVLEAARFADREGFTSIWVPERHFTAMGSLYPNPSVLHAALARETRHVRLMAGSVVVPLHNPVRIAEEWAVVDNLSGGRVGMSFASGWNPHDFVLAPGRFAERHRLLYEGIAQLRKLWRGEPFEHGDDTGKVSKLRTYPTPIQPELPVWITAARSPQSFEQAGALGANLLTHLLDQDIDALAAQVARYRAARERAGLDPATGRVTVMCHTFIGRDRETVDRLTRKPFCDYLKTNIGLFADLARSRSRDADLSTLPPGEIDEFVNFLYDRFVGTRALIGTVESCRDMVVRLEAAGVDEIACLLDFGPPSREVFESLPALLDLRHATRPPAPAPARPAHEGVARLRDARAHCGTAVPVDAVYTRLELAGQHVDPVDRLLTEVSRTDGESMARIDASALPDREAYAMHPAILDACLQSMIAALPQGADTVYLPLRIDSVRSVAPAHGVLWSLGRLTADTGDTIVADLSVLTDAGDLVFEARGITALKRRLQPETAARERRTDTDFFQLTWEPAGSPNPAATGQTQPWLILGEGRGIARTLRATLKRLGVPAIVASIGSSGTATDTRELTADLDSESSTRQFLDTLDVPTDRLANIVYLGALDAAVADIDQSRRLALHIPLFLAQALSTAYSSTPLWFATVGAVHVPQAPRAMHPGQAPLWGFGRALAREHAARRSGLVDLDPIASNAQQTAQLYDAVARGDREDQFAMRDGQTFVPRLARYAPSDVAPVRLHVRPDASYLITGGAGGLGTAVAQWLASHGAGAIILAGRRPSAAHPNTALAVGLGARVRYIEMDVADETAVQTFLADHTRTHPDRPLRGVVHAAGVWEDRAIGEMDTASLDRVLRPKVSGVAVLDRLLDGHALDFFVLFSSFSSIVPPAGQASYAAANAFLDAVVQDRRDRGRPALSINWGPWSEVGFASTGAGAAAHRVLEHSGITRFTPAEGVARLERLLRTSSLPAHVGVITLDVARLHAADPWVANAPIFANFINGGARRAAPAAAAAPITDAAALRRLLTLTVSDVLQLPAPGAATDVPLDELGLDSLMAVEIKNRLAAEAGVDIPLVELLKGTTIASLAERIRT